MLKASAPEHGRNPHGTEIVVPLTSCHRQRERTHVHAVKTTKTTRSQRKSQHYTHTARCTRTKNRPQNRKHGLASTDAEQKEPKHSYRCSSRCTQQHNIGRPNRPRLRRTRNLRELVPAPSAGGHQTANSIKWPPLNTPHSTRRTSTQPFTCRPQSSSSNIFSATPPKGTSPRCRARWPARRSCPAALSQRVWPDGAL